MTDVSVILNAIGKSNEGFLLQVDKLAHTVGTLNDTIIRLNSSMEHQSENHDSLKDIVHELKSEIAIITKEVDELKLYGKVRHDRRRWWANNWSKLLSTVIICASAIGFVAITYNNIKPSN